MFAALASCVFLWGLQYKLSLYDPPQVASHQVPMAKLLSRNEQPNPSEQLAYNQTKPAIKVLRAVSGAALFFMLIVCVFCLPESSQRERVENPPLQFRQALLETFFVRPPPFLS
jgi:hypothetical protein